MDHDAMIEALGDIGAFEWGMILVALALFALFLHIYNKTPHIRETPRSFRAALALLTSWAILYGGSKPGPSGHVSIDDPYIRDDGSWLSPSNNVAHVAIAKKSSLLPDGTAILVYAREVAQSNVTDWVRIMPHLTFADHPHDYLLPGVATNYNVLVAASFTPGPTVHTNGVWAINGFIIPGSSGKMGFKQTTTILIQEEP